MPMHKFSVLTTSASSQLSGKSARALAASIHKVQGSHRLEKYLNLEGFLEKSLKIKNALKRTGKSYKGLEKSLNSSIFCRN